MDNNDLTFGKRFGLEPIEIPFQVNDINTNFRIELWNAHFIFIQMPIQNATEHQIDQYRSINKVLWVHFFIKNLDEFPSYNSEFRNFVKDYFTTCEWYKIYEFFEFVFRNISKSNLFSVKDFKSYIAGKLRENNAGYTIFENKFIPIINETEIESIKTAQASSKKYNLSTIQKHLNSSLELLSQKPLPDFRNSIKESISMVEAISRIIEPENTLGKALNALDKKQKINNTLKAGFEKLYAYTNDKNGIRHALMDDENLDIEDAKFFVVSCSAFTNYLIEKAVKEKILK